MLSFLCTWLLSLHMTWWLDVSHSTDMTTPLLLLLRLNREHRAGARFSGASGWRRQRDSEVCSRWKPSSQQLLLPPEGPAASQCLIHEFLFIGSPVGSPAGVPSPTSVFTCLFVWLQGNVVKVENTNTYTLTNVSRSDAGEYKCSLIDDPTLEASKSIVINCKEKEIRGGGRDKYIEKETGRRRKLSLLL